MRKNIKTLNFMIIYIYICIRESHNDNEVQCEKFEIAYIRINSEMEFITVKS